MFQKSLTFILLALHPSGGGFALTKTTTCEEIWVGPSLNNEPMQHRQRLLGFIQCQETSEKKQLLDGQWGSFSE